VLRDHPSGEVECVAYSFEDGIFVGLGSDHTDRKAETISVYLSKPMCTKPVSQRSSDWRTWRHIGMRRAAIYVDISGKRRLYQEDSVSAMRPLNELFRLYSKLERLPVDTAMFCGTLAVHGGVTPAETFDEVGRSGAARRIRHSYRVKTPPDHG
jgi:Protein of unknown function (DUF2848)